jgi:hypothetical protein
MAAGRPLFPCGTTLDERRNQSLGIFNLGKKRKDNYTVVRVEIGYLRKEGLRDCAHVVPCISYTASDAGDLTHAYVSRWLRRTILNGGGSGPVASLTT